MPRQARNPFPVDSEDYEAEEARREQARMDREERKAALAESVANGTAVPTRRVTVEVPLSTVATAKMLATLSQEEDFRVILGNAADQMVQLQAAKIRELLTSDDMPF